MAASRVPDQWKASVDDLYYVDPSADLHYKTNVQLNSPGLSGASVPGASYLLTSGLTFCVGIAFIYEPGAGAPCKIGLFHSVGEHTYGSENSAKFQKAIEAFMQDVSDITKVRIILNLDLNQYDEQNKMIQGGQQGNGFMDIQNVRDFIRQWSSGISIKSYDIKEEQKEEQEIVAWVRKGCPSTSIPIESPIKISFFRRDSSSTFYVTDQGEYGTLQEAAQKAIDSIKGMISPDDCKKHKHFQDIVNVDPKKGGAIATLKTIKEIAQDYLKKQHLYMQRHSDILFFKIIAWDAVLNKPSARLLDVWSEKNRCTISDGLKKKILKEEILGERADVSLENQSQSSSSSLRHR